MFTFCRIFVLGRTYLPVCQYVSQSLFVCPFVCQSVYLFVDLCLSVYLSISLCVSVSVCLSVCLSLSLSLSIVLHHNEPIKQIVPQCEKRLLVTYTDKEVLDQSAYLCRLHREFIATHRLRFTTLLAVQ